MKKRGMFLNLGQGKTMGSGGLKLIIFKQVVLVIETQVSTM